MVNKLLLLIPFLLIGFIPGSFAEIEKGLNYDKEIIATNPDGSNLIKWTSHFERIEINNTFKDFIFTETEDKLILETAIGSVTLDKNSCSFNYHNKGLIVDNPIPLFSDSIVSYNSVVDLYSWNPVNQINNASCEAYYDSDNQALIAKRYASGIGFMEYKYIFTNNAWKTQLEATNLTTLTDRVFGFDQTIDLNRDTIKYGGNIKNLDNFDGQTFDRDWLTSNRNQGKVIDLLNNFNFDFDLGFENLDSITITDTGSNKSKLTFHYMRNNNILMPNETLIIDPTFGYTAGTFDSWLYNAYGAGANCANTNSWNYAGGTQITKQNTGNSAQTCAYMSWTWNITSIPNDTETIATANFKYTVDSIGSVQNCDVIALMSTDPTTAPIGNSAQSDSVMSNMHNGDRYADNDTSCKTASSDKVIALNAQALTDIKTQLANDWFAVGFYWEDIVRDVTIEYAITVSTTASLEVYYYTVPKPDSITDLTLDSATQTTATVSFSAPNLNTGNLTTYTFNLDTPQNNNVQTFFANSTDNPFIMTGLTLGTSYSANATAITEGGGNYTLANILNFTTPTWDPPGAPTLSATALSDTAIRFTSTPGTAGHNSTIWFSFQCEKNGSGGWVSTVSNSSYISFYEYTGLTLGDVNICQWRDGSVDGWGTWSNNATDILALTVLSAQRTIADSDDKLMQFIGMVSGMGGVYFGLGVLPFGVMLIGFMAGKKTVRIFTLATLFLMGIIHASGYFIYPNWYWTLALLFGIILVMGRMKSD